MENIGEWLRLANELFIIAPVVGIAMGTALILSSLLSGGAGFLGGGGDGTQERKSFEVKRGEGESLEDFQRRYALGDPQGLLQTSGKGIARLGQSMTELAEQDIRLSQGSVAQAPRMISSPDTMFDVGPTARDPAIADPDILLRRGRILNDPFQSLGGYTSGGGPGGGGGGGGVYGGNSNPGDPDAPGTQGKPYAPGPDDIEGPGNPLPIGGPLPPLGTPLPTPRPTPPPEETPRGTAFPFEPEGFGQDEPGFESRSNVGFDAGDIVSRITDEFMNKDPRYTGPYKKTSVQGRMIAPLKWLAGKLGAGGV